jgi:hypothetical protein
MGVLKRKDERTQTITVRVPESIKAELDRLREESNAAGFDLNATLSDAVIRITRQVREELRQLGSKANVTSRANGLAAADGKAA